MKTTIKVTEFSHEELVHILSTALYGSSWFEANYDKRVYKCLETKTGECFEDKLADVLLAGHKIIITDVDADGESYSNKFVKFDGNSARYEICLQDFLDVASTPDGYELVKDVLEGVGDYWTADNFLQRVVFGECIYG